MKVDVVEDVYQAAGEFVDSDHPEIIQFAKEKAAGAEGLKEKAVQIYYAIRDGWRYDPYGLDFRAESMKASNFLKRKQGHCVEKACLYAASCRAIGIASRLRFAKVRNHIGTEKLEEYLGTDVLVFHGYVELHLDGKWVKATPAFNKALCDRLGVAPLDFDGENDSLFQEFDHAGGLFMKYLHDYGHFPDIPRDLFIDEIRTHYPHIFNAEAAEKFGIHVRL